MAECLFFIVTYIFSGANFRFILLGDQWNRPRDPLFFRPALQKRRLEAARGGRMAGQRARRLTDTKRIPPGLRCGSLGG